MKKFIDLLVGNFGKSTSVAGSFNKTDALKVLRTSAMIAVAAVGGHLLGFFEANDWGLYEIVLVAVIETAMRWAKSNDGE